MTLMISFSLNAVFVTGFEVYKGIFDLWITHHNIYSIFKHTVDVLHTSFENNEIIKQASRCVLAWQLSTRSFEICC